MRLTLTFQGASARAAFHPPEPQSPCPSRILIYFPLHNRHNADFPVGGRLQHTVRDRRNRASRRNVGYLVPVSAQVNSPWVNFIVQLTGSSNASVVGGSSSSFPGNNLQSTIGPLTLSCPDVVSSETFTINGAYSFIRSKLNW